MPIRRQLPRIEESPVVTRGGGQSRRLSVMHWTNGVQSVSFAKPIDLGVTTISNAQLAIDTKPEALLILISLTEVVVTIVGVHLLNFIPRVSAGLTESALGFKLNSQREQNSESQSLIRPCSQPTQSHIRIPPQNPAGVAERRISSPTPP